MAGTTEARIAAATYVPSMMQSNSAALCAALLVFGSSAAPVRPGDIRASQFVKRTTVLSTGITMSYVEAGPTDGEPVIFLHGLSDTSRSFFQTMEALQAIDGELHLFALDARGHGASSLPAGPECPATQIG